MRVRFITPIFLHAGLVHLALNMFAQILVSAQVRHSISNVIHKIKGSLKVEREMGSAGFIILYFAAGIFGNILGANFA
jgi:membrane associated rhomboid family serine protease